MSDKNNSSSSFAAGIVGAIIGAAATVAAVVLSDEKNRKKAEKILKDVEKEGTKAFKEVTRMAKELKVTNQKKVKNLPPS